MKTQISKEQRVTFSLSMLSSISSNYDPTQTSETIEEWTKKKTQEILTDPRIISDIGEWKIVWGPQVATGLKGISKNSMFIANSVDDPTKYIIAIAGTNPKSLYDWKVEDCAVEADEMVAWNKITLNKDSTNYGKISKGTYSGINILFNMKDTSTGKSFIEFISPLLNQKNSIKVTGHSLGGALSPSIALYINDEFSNPASINYNPNYASNVSCMSTAGPTPGDAVFAEHYNEIMATDSVRFWNTSDIVPHAWKDSLLKKIPSIYVPFGIEKTPFITNVTQRALTKSQGGEYTQLLGDGSPLDHEYIKVDNSLDPYKQFLAEAAQQHTTAYNELFQITDYMTKVIQEKTGSTK
ncbi:lipase family protein [Polaribacter sp. SA4-12]|uniref:lipase family protein n=1 Tax=Polaribacter sp. SA4-12 TaxID=1312072 RepID=UPI000B3C70E5|nr:hypothetical protein [Polaribacter sp. SA4-12]ARV14691.1 hypothetical protein BTO07_05790 [Polaribacter sp. SA4-12]